ncbi:protein of unknown function (plasmid) [Cupriavidus neocaledonicus]|uniref:Uncharacterized protein n=1 Tax=Cupriavidus neocaledonicus TaxID=1040979 RepID=A0A375HRD8_9BURK|nr:exported hypothetical protein [Cupriavidus neocaledonicus]SPD59995.1 protein of unknown function [Cupriavidus neocaledonicus]
MPATRIRPIPPTRWGRRTTRPTRPIPPIRHMAIRTTVRGRPMAASPSSTAAVVITGMAMATTGGAAGMAEGTGVGTGVAEAVAEEATERWPAWQCRAARVTIGSRSPTEPYRHEQARTEAPAPTDETRAAALPRRTDRARTG